MAGAEFPFKLILDFGRINLVLLGFGVEIGFCRGEQHVHAGLAQFCAVGFEGTRIFVEIFARTELQTVDEDAGDDRVAEGACLLHQRNMAGV